jgi:hypothetical protein
MQLACCLFRGGRSEAGAGEAATSKGADGARSIGGRGGVRSE